MIFLIRNLSNFKILIIILAILIKQKMKTAEKSKRIVKDKQKIIKMNENLYIMNRLVNKMNQIK
jgi:hypothetical protein